MLVEVINFNQHKSITSFFLFFLLSIKGYSVNHFLNFSQNHKNIDNQWENVNIPTKVCGSAVQVDNKDSDKVRIKRLICRSTMNISYKMI